MHDLKCNSINEVIRHLALLLMIRVGDGKCGAEVVALLFEFENALLLLFLAFCAACFAGLDACVDVIKLFLVVALEHFFEVREKVTAPSYPFAFTNLPLALLAFEDVL